MKRAFISYSRVDADHALSLAAEVELLGHNVWIDQKIGGGQKWWSEILAEIRKCDFLIFCTSEASLSSEICRMELDFAEQLGKPILPVMFDEAVLVHPILSERQVARFPNSGYEHRRGLARALELLPPCPPLPDPEPSPPRIPTLPLVEISRRLRAATLALSDQEDILRSLTELLAKGDNAAEVKLLAAELRSHVSVALRVAEELDRILKISPASISERRSQLTRAWECALSEPISALSSYQSSEIIMAADQGGHLIERNADTGAETKAVDIEMSVCSMDLSDEKGIFAVAGRSLLVLRSNLATRDPFGNRYEHTIGIGRVNDLEEKDKGYPISIAKPEDASVGKQPEEYYRGRNAGWSLAGPTGQIVQPVPSFRCVALSPSNDRVAFGLDDGTLLVWCLRWHRIINRVTLTGADSIRALRFIGRDLFAGDYGGRVFKVDDNLCVNSSVAFHKSPICGLLFDHSSKTVLSVSTDGEMSRLAMDDLSRVASERSQRRVVCADSPGYGSLFVTGQREGWISLVSFVTLQEVSRFHAMESPVNTIFWARNGEWIVAAGESKIICLRSSL